MLAGVAAYFQKGCGSIKADYKKIVNKFGTDKILIVILAGVFLMAAAFPSGHSSASKESSTTAIESESMSTDMYEEYVEKRLEKILADVDGVGKVKVMLSIRNSTEKVLAKDETYSESEKKEASDGSSNQTNDTQNISTHIFYDTSDGSRPYVVMENMPVIDGAIIVCEGGDNKELVNDITNAVYGLLNVPVHKIKVMKMS